MSRHLDDLTPQAREALEDIGARILAQPRPLCPRCVRREVNTRGDWCPVCEDAIDAERREADRAAKRKWWRNKGAERRREESEQ